MNAVLQILKTPISVPLWIVVLIAFNQFAWLFKLAF